MLFKQCGHQNREANLEFLTCTSCKVENSTFLAYGLKAYNLLGKSHLCDLVINLTASMSEFVHYGVELVYKDSLHNYNIARVDVNNAFITGSGDVGLHVLLNRTEYGVIMIVNSSRFLYHGSTSNKH